MIFSLGFPIWQYLRQPIFDKNHPIVLNPNRYWQCYILWHLEQCLKSDWIEYCWHLDYYQFVKKCQGFVERHYFEEETTIFLEHCWTLQHWRYGLRCHPEEILFDT